MNGTPEKPGHAHGATALLRRLEVWRGQLAGNLALRNPELTQRNLCVAVPQTLGRIIFLRMCEARASGPSADLQTLRSGPQAYARLCHLFCTPGARYQVEPSPVTIESGRQAASDIEARRLAVDDAVLRDIIDQLNDPDDPYQFSALGAEFLGQVYEQSVGKPLRRTGGQRQIARDRTNAKKSGGIYYTPTFIVAYIVQHTLGELLAGQTPQLLRGTEQQAPLSILDPACGGGAFLIGAYQFLLDWYHAWYLAHTPGQHSQAVHQTDHGCWRLTRAERQRILVDHIYGLDIDPQAVEVTKLSLWLKVLEAEHPQTAKPPHAAIRETRLPDLSDNIKCGNSLADEDCGVVQPSILSPEGIGPSTCAAHVGQALLPVENRTTGKSARPATIAPVAVPRERLLTPLNAGGFDAVIGNPPYIRIQLRQDQEPGAPPFRKPHFRAASRGNHDIYVAFVERGLSLLKPQGRLGFILPHKFFNAAYGGPLRELLSQGQHVTQIVHFGAQQVFSGATTYTCLLFLNKSGSRRCRFMRVPNLANWIETGVCLQGDIPAAQITGGVWNFTVGPDAALVERLRSMPVKLGDVADIFVGLQTSADEVFILDLVQETARTLRLRSRALGETRVFEKALFHPLVSGTDARSYAPLPRRQYILFPYEVTDERATLLDWATLQAKYPQAAAYLAENRVQLEARERGRFRGSDWYRFGRSQNLGIQGRPKLCVPRLVDVLRAAFDHSGSHFLDNVDVGGITLRPESASCDLPYLLALLNSKLLAWFFPHISAPFRGHWLSANRQFLAQLPVYLPDVTNAFDRTRLDRLRRLVQQLLALHDPIAKRSPAETTVVSRRAATLRAQIDRLVYELYRLTDEDVRTVEAATSG